MLIKFDTLVKKYGIPRGIIHLGAHLAEELEDYLEHNQKDVVWIEGNPSLFDELHKRVSDAGHLLFCELLSDVDGVEMNFNIAKNHYNGNYQSSSILDFGTHAVHHPNIVMESKLILRSKKISTIFSENGLSFSDYNFVNIDLQGYELPALKGFGDAISGMDFIYSEVNTGEVYKGCTKIEELDEYLGSYGFQRVETEMTDAEWGDAFYIKIEN
jgi:FkbM family methyltransferase